MSFESFLLAVVFKDWLPVVAFSLETHIIPEWLELVCKPSVHVSEPPECVSASLQKLTLTSNKAILAFAARLTKATHYVTLLLYINSLHRLVLDHLSQRFSVKIRIITCMLLAARKWR